MTAAARAFLETLAPSQRDDVLFDFNSEERFDWHFTPRRRAGLPLRDMGEAQRTAAHELLRSGLSETGCQKALYTMRLEAVLKEMETFGFSRDPDNYAVVMFGDPQSAPWGWRFEGHHLSLNFTVGEQGQTTITPAFFGSNPATVAIEPLKGLRTLALEEDLARDLVSNLDSDQLARAVIADRSFGDILTGPGRDEALSAPGGLPIGALAGSQRDAAAKLIDVYLDNASPTVAMPHRSLI